jgi:hypothetical protein
VKLMRRPSATQPTPEDAAESRSAAELLAERDRLTERFALQQSELGGLFYEMAIRDHVQMDVLIAKAAALQRLDAELAQLELLRDGSGSIGGQCPNCGATFARGAAFCSQCATSLAQV